MKVANIHFEATGSNRIDYGPTSNNIHIRTGSGNGNFTVTIGSSEMINVNSSSVMVTGNVTYGGVTLANAVTGTGSMVLSTQPTLAAPIFTTPTLGAATATSINGNFFTSGTYTVTGAASKTLTFSNSLTLAGTDATTMTFPAITGTVGVLTNQGNWTKQQYFGTATLTDGATISWDSAAAQVAKVTLAGNRTMAAPSNLADGSFYSIYIIQDGTGSRTMTWNSVFKFTAAAAPTLTTTAAAKDFINFRSDGTNLYEIGRSLAVG